MALKKEEITVILQFAKIFVKNHISVTSNMDLYNMLGIFDYANFILPSLKRYLVLLLLLEPYVPKPHTYIDFR